MYEVSKDLIPKKISKTEAEEKIKRIIKRIQSYRAPDDVIAYLFAHLESERIPTSPKIIHTAFSKLKKDPKGSTLFKDFIFSTGDVHPYSSELERVLFRFQQSGILGMLNPSMEYYVFSKEKKDEVINYLEKKNAFSSEEKEILQELIEGLEKLLSHQDTT